MNLLIASDYAAPYAGNFICSINELCKKLTEKNDKVFFAFPNKCQDLYWVKDLEKKYSVFFGMDLKNLLSVISKNKIDLVYTHFCLPKTQCMVKVSTRVARIPLVQHWHNHYQKWGGIKGRIADWAFKGDMNIGCSKPVAESLPFPEKRKTFVENAIDFSRLDQYDKNYSFADNKDQKVILMFGFDYKRKGVDLAVEALKPIAEKKNIKLVISLSKNHEKVRSKIIEQCGQVPEWIQIVDAQDDVATYYHASDIFLSAAREEGFCYALIEAAYCGCNLISSEIDGVPYQEIPYCKVFTSENVEELRKVICDSLCLNTERQKQECKAAVEKKFSLTGWVENELIILRK